MKNKMDKEAYLDKVISHYDKEIDLILKDRTDGNAIRTVLAPCEVKILLHNAAYYGIHWKENYDYVMKNW